jgi:hypothetical protein
MRTSVSRDEHTGLYTAIERKPEGIAVVIKDRCESLAEAVQAIKEYKESTCPTKPSKR